MGDFFGNCFWGVWDEGRGCRAGKSRDVAWRFRQKCTTSWQSGKDNAQDVVARQDQICRQPCASRPILAGMRAGARKIFPGVKIQPPRGQFARPLSIAKSGAKGGGLHAPGTTDRDRPPTPGLADVTNSSLLRSCRVGPPRLGSPCAKSRNAGQISIDAPPAIALTLARHPNPARITCLTNP